MSITPAPIFNHRKRPRQSLVTDPQQNIGSFSGPGPSGAAPYHDLMPPGGFGNNSKQPGPQPGRSNNPTSGHGAAVYQQQSSYGNNQSGANQVGQNMSRYGAPNNNKQSFSSNNSLKPQQTQIRQQNQTFSSQNKQQSTSGQSWGQRPGPNTSNQQNASGSISSWSRNTGNPISYNNQTGYGNNNNNQTGYGNSNNSQAGYGNNNNTQTSFGSGNNNATGYGNSNNSQRGYGNSNNSQAGYGNRNNSQAGYGNNNNTQTGFSSGNNNATGYGNSNNNNTTFGNKSTWIRNGSNQSNTPQRFNGRNMAQNNQQGSRGGFGVNNNSNPQSRYGSNTKMVASTSSSRQVDNRQTGNRTFNNTSITNQGAASQYRFKGSHNQAMSVVPTDGTDMDEWDASFDESTQGMNLSAPNVQKEKKPVKVQTKPSPQDSGVRLLTVNVNGMKRWNKFKDSFSLLFEMFGLLDSAVTKNSTDCKEFTLCDGEKNAVKCVFFEIDRQIPKMTRGMMYRVVGTYDRTNDRLKCSSVRSTSDREIMLGTKLASLCTQAMVGETRTLREI